ncbi:MAG: hypothetical protein HKN23_03185 [Verrucomicrobiales bacterium]|nr:hypothetical protein [Verrucomicrobiales bacterium]
MDATQNHYGTFDFISPMIFLGVDRYETQTGLFSTLKRLAAGRQYEDFLALTDNPDDVVQLIEQWPPEGYAG